MISYPFTGVITSSSEGCK